MPEGTVKLTIKDRLIIPNILPSQGGLVTQRISKDIRKKVQFSQDEIKKFNMRDVQLPGGGQSVAWDTVRKETNAETGETVEVPVEGIEIEVTFTEAEKKMLSESVA